MCVCAGDAAAAPATAARLYWVPDVYANASSSSYFVEYNSSLGDAIQALGYCRAQQALVVLFNGGTVAQLAPTADGLVVSDAHNMTVPVRSSCYDIPSQL